MSRSFRPVIEHRGAHSSCFLDSDEVEEVLSALADRVEGSTLYDSCLDGECTRLQFTGATKLLAWLAGMDVPAIAGELVDDPNFQVGIEEEQWPQLVSLLENIKSLAPEWAACVDADGDYISFLID